LEVKTILKLEIEIPRDAFFSVVGKRDINLKYFSDIFNLKVFSRGTSVIAEGEEESLDRFEKFMEKIASLYEKGHILSEQDIRNLALGFKLHLEKEQEPVFESGDTILFSHRKKPIIAKTPSQKLYIETIKKNDITFGIGPAGTGKTYLAMAMAVSYLKQQKINRIILTRPAVEAGEKLGFLPESTIS